MTHHARAARVERNAALHFALRFLLWWIAGMAATSAWPAVDALARAWTARCTQLVLIGSVADGASPGLAWSGVRLGVDSECTPVLATLVLWSAMFAYPAGWPERLRGAALGLVVLWCANVLRIVTLALVLRSWPALFEPMHIVLWQGLTMLLIVLLFRIWRRYGIPSDAAGAP